MKPMESFIKKYCPMWDIYLYKRTFYILKNMIIVFIGIEKILLLKFGCLLKDNRTSQSKNIRILFSGCFNALTYLLNRDCHNFQGITRMFFVTKQPLISNLYCVTHSNMRIPFYYLGIQSRKIIK